MESIDFSVTEEQVVFEQQEFSVRFGETVDVTPEGIGALAVYRRLSEFDTEQKKLDARSNLGLQHIDGGTF